MIIQSGGGKIYAVLAKNKNFNLGILPQLTLVSTTIFLHLRCRYMDEKNTFFDPMLAPKQVLVAGDIERSKNTLRGFALLNTGVTIDKINKHFSTDAAKLLWEASKDYLVGPGVCVSNGDLRGDFVEDFAPLINAQIEVFYPPLDFTETVGLTNAFDLEQMKAAAVPLQSGKGFQVIDQGNAEDDNVVKIGFGDKNETVDKPTPEVPEKGDAAE